jgi:dihydroneopterin aldolase
MSDRILISRLQLETIVGVPDLERASPQRVAASVEIEVDTHEAARTDSIRATVDYAAVAEAMRRVAAARPRHLIETLAEELAAEILAFEGARAVVLTLDKYVLPDAESASVRIERRRR